MSNRLKELRKALKINQTEFARRLGITQTALSMIETEINRLTDKHIKLVCATFNVSEVWIRYGVGDMFNSFPYEKEFNKIFNKLTPEAQDHLYNTAKSLLEIQNKIIDSQAKEKK